MNRTSIPLQHRDLWDIGAHRLRRWTGNHNTTACCPDGIKLPGSNAASPASPLYPQRRRHQFSLHTEFGGVLWCGKFNRSNPPISVCWFNCSSLSMAISTASKHSSRITGRGYPLRPAEWQSTAGPDFDQQRLWQIGDSTRVMLLAPPSQTIWPLFTA